MDSGKCGIYMYMYAAFNPYLLINLYHSLGEFSRRQVDNIFFLFCPENILIFIAYSIRRNPAFEKNLHERVEKPVFWEK